MRIVGFQSGHDTSYCVLEDGIPVLHNEWERFLRKKEPHGDGLKLFFEKHEDMSDIGGFTHGNPGGRGANWQDMHPDKGEWPSFHKDVEAKRCLVAPYREYSHHMCHAANAFFSSNFDKALIVTIDGGGSEFALNDGSFSLRCQKIASEDGKLKKGDLIPTALTVWYGEGSELLWLYMYKLENLNIGITWNNTTEEVFGLSWGWPNGCSAGTVMAMAAFGDPDKYSDEFYSAIKGVTVTSPTGDVSVENLTDEQAKKLKEIADRSEQDAFDVAAGLQNATERHIKEILDKWTVAVPIKNLCLAGGVALNSVAVGKIYDWYPHIENIYIPPVPYDSGLSIGSAQYHWHHVMGNPRIKWEDNATPYLGKTYSKEEILDALEKENLDFEYVEDDYVVDLLAKDNNIISVFGGGSESGRRALGNRSIIADPRSPDMKKVINDKVKHRQWFRPFAPSILREEVKNWFVKDVDSPYMSAVLKWKEEVRSNVPAVDHYDGTARLQTVTEKDNKWYYNFIRKFSMRTGVPIVLNTSFNDREPIVETPENGIACFLKTNIDYLYFFDVGILVKK